MSGVNKDVVIHDNLIDSNILTAAFVIRLKAFFVTYFGGKFDAIIIRIGVALRGSVTTAADADVLSMPSENTFIKTFYHVKS